MFNSTHLNNTYVENVMESQFTLSIIESFILVFFSELADKTFILILILKLKSNAITVFFSAFIGMAALSILSVTFGYFLDYLLYQNFIDLLAVAILLFSGIGMIIQGFTRKGKTYEDELLTNIKGELKQEKHREKLIQNKKIIEEQLSKISREIEDIEGSSCDQENSLKEPLLKANTCFQFKRLDNDLAQISNKSEDIAIKRESENQIKEIQIDNVANQNNSEKGVCYYFWAFFKAILIAEFGDKTQFSLFALSSVFNSYGVLFGAIGALILVILLGVVYGNKISKKISERTMCLICGFIFLIISFQVVYLNSYLNFLN